MTKRERKYHWKKRLQREWLKWVINGIGPSKFLEIPYVPDPNAKHEPSDGLPF